MFGEIIGHTFRRWFHGFFTGTPVGRADVAVLLEELKRVEQAHRFARVAAERQVVDEFVLSRKRTQ